MPAQPDASEALRRAGVPALTGADPVFQGRPVDSYDANGHLVSREVRPVTRQRLTSLVARIRQHGGPHVTPTGVRAMGIRLLRESGSDGGGQLGHRDTTGRRFYPSAAAVDGSYYIRERPADGPAGREQ